MKQTGLTSLMPISDLLDSIRMAGEMASMRQTAKQLYGDRYDALVSQYRDVLRDAMQLLGMESPVTALLHIEKAAGDKLSERDMLLLISAAVDLIDPTATNNVRL